MSHFQNYKAIQFSIACCASHLYMAASITMKTSIFLFIALISPLISALPSSDRIDVCHSDEDHYYFTNLKSIKFDCSEQHFEYEKFDLSESKFYCTETLINKSEVNELTINWCNFNKIPSEIFKKFENLKKFTIKSENIESIKRDDFIDANKLEFLGIYGNGIRYGESLFTNVPKIREFYVFNVEKSYFHNDALKGSHQPKILNLKQSDVSKTDRNQIFDISTDIESIILANCSIQHIESLNIHLKNQIKWIDLENNLIAELTEKSFEKLNHLRIVNLLHNSIKNIASNTFAKLNRLVFLGLSWNQLESLSKGMLEGASNVMFATFHGNKIKTIEADTFSVMKNLKKLILSYNEISTLDPHTFNGLRNLEFLELSYNPIASFDASTFNDLTKLKELGLRDGKLTAIDFNTFAKLPNLKFLDLSGNLISKLIKAENRTTDVSSSNDVVNAPLAKVDKDLLQLFFEHDYILKMLNISFDRGMELFNATKDIVYPSNENKLTILDLSQNDLTTLDDNVFNGFENLRGLYLHRNKISSVYLHAFDGLLKLTHLDLSQCQLTAVDFEAYSHLSKIQELNFKNNQIKNVIIPRSMQPFKNLMKMNLEDNKLIWKPSFNRKAFPKLNAK